MFKCIFCNQLSKDRSYCDFCGEEIFTEYSLDNLNKIYNILLSKHHFTDYFIRFKKESFPLKFPSGHIHYKNTLIDRLFSIGYMVRFCEELISSVSHNNQHCLSDNDIMEVMNSDRDDYSKIIKIVYLLSAKHASFTPQQIADTLSFVGGKDLLKIINVRIVSFFEEQHSQLYVWFPRKKEMKRFIWDNIWCGYYFRIGESLVVSVRK